MQPSNPSNPSRRASRSARFALSMRGYATELAYRRGFREARNRPVRMGFEMARAKWARCHGLDPDDGPYLSELRQGALSLRQIGEGMAICSQTIDMVHATVRRLISKGFISEVDRGAASTAPTKSKAEDELALAEVDLGALRGRLSTCAPEDWRVVALPLREAVFRVIVARSFLDTFSRSTRR